MRTQFTLHKITSPDQFTFDPADYSRFKFGDENAARRFGIALAKGFIEAHFSQCIPQNQLVVISSPYSFIPTATFAMKDYFVYELNKFLAEKNAPVVQETKIHRTITYKEDYGELDAEKRMKLIGNDKFHIDKSFLTDKTLIFLDDIRITGSHERMINKMIDEHELKNDVYMLYFAQLMDMSIPPNIENYLNYYAVKSIFDLHDIISGEDFAINTRLVKYLLNYDSEDFGIFMETQQLGLMNKLYNMALGNGYHTIEAYQTNLSQLKNLVVSRSEKKLWKGFAKQNK
jgi:hypothetical protein